MVLSDSSLKILINWKMFGLPLKALFKSNSVLKYISWDLRKFFSYDLIKTLLFFLVSNAI